VINAREIKDLPKSGASPYWIVFENSSYSQDNGYGDYSTVPVLSTKVFTEFKELQSYVELYHARDLRVVACQPMAVTVSVKVDVGPTTTTR
jgi:hypothetical protein